MLTLLLCSLNQEYAYKDFFQQTKWFLLLALKSIDLEEKPWSLTATKGNWTKRHFDLDKDKIEIAHEYEYLEIDLYSHGHFEPLSKRQRIAGMKALMGNLKKERVVIVTCWKLKSHLFKAMVLPTFTYGSESLGGDLRNSHWKDFEKGVKTLMMSHAKEHSLTS